MQKGLLPQSLQAPAGKYVAQLEKTHIPMRQLRIRDLFQQMYITQGMVMAEATNKPNWKALLVDLVQSYHGQSMLTNVYIIAIAINLIASLQHGSGSPYGCPVITSYIHVHKISRVTVRPVDCVLKPWKDIVKNTRMTWMVIMTMRFP